VKPLIDGRADEHVAGEQRVPGICGDEAHAYSVGRIGPGKQVLREQLAPLQIGLHPRLQHGEFRRRQFLVDLAPPDRVAATGLVGDELVLHRAAGVHSGAHDQRAIRGEPALVASDRVLQELRRGQIGMDGRAGEHPGSG
jgi:hypothetical protein